MHRKSRRVGTRKHRGNSILRSWVAFVKKVQKDENVSYKDAMMLAKKRKSEWKRGGAQEDVEMDEVVDNDNGDVIFSEEEEELKGGRRRKRSMRRGRGKARASRRR